MEVVVLATCAWVVGALGLLAQFVLWAVQLLGVLLHLVLLGREDQHLGGAWVAPWVCPQLVLLVLLMWLRCCWSHHAALAL